MLNSYNLESKEIFSICFASGIARRVAAVVRLPVSGSERKAIQ